MKTEVHHTEASIHTRIKWISDFKAQFPTRQRPSIFISISGYEELVLETYTDISRSHTIDLIAQCRAVGLDRLANDYEGSLGEITKKEQRLMYPISQDNL